jgi:hypothetical protein
MLLKTMRNRKRKFLRQNLMSRCFLALHQSARCLTITADKLK